MGKKSRRTWSSKETLRIVLAGFEGGVEVSELYRREGISPTRYSNWMSQLLRSADQVYGQTKEKPNRKQVRLESELNCSCQRLLTQVKMSSDKSSQIMDGVRCPRQRFRRSSQLATWFASAGVLAILTLTI